ncbi:MAG: ferredoxin [Candidatus Andersenbacteria bacterium]
MRIEVKRDICIGAATCTAIAPDVFALDDENKAVVTNPQGADQDTILEAARSCPTLAIYIYDDADKQIFPPPLVAESNLL